MKYSNKILSNEIFQLTQYGDSHEILWTKQTILSDAILSSRMSEGNANNKQISLILLLNF